MYELKPMHHWTRVQWLGIWRWYIDCWLASQITHLIKLVTVFQYVYTWAFVKWVASLLYWITDSQNYRNSKSLWVKFARSLSLSLIPAVFLHTLATLEWFTSKDLESLQAVFGATTVLTCIAIGAHDEHVVCLKQTAVRFVIISVF